MMFSDFDANNKGIVNAVHGFEISRNFRLQKVNDFGNVFAVKTWPDISPTALNFTNEYCKNRSSFLVTKNQLDSQGRWCGFFDDLSNGTWDFFRRRYFPPACQLRQVTPESARQCIGNRSFIFIGDSQIRDFSGALAYFLSGVDESEAIDTKMDVKDKN